MAPLSRLDHVIVAVRDLEPAAKTFVSLGFRLTPLGLHEGKGTGNRCIMFGDAYIELLGIVDETGATGRLAAMVAERGEGGIGVAYGSADADATYQALRTADIAVEAPNDLSRPLELDGKKHLVRFRNVMMPSLLPTGLLQFACHHATPELTRARDEWQLHANGAIKLREVTVAVTDVGSLRKQAASLYGEERLEHADDELIVSLDNLTLRFAMEPALARRFPAKALPQRLMTPGVVALSIGVHEIDAAMSMMDAANVKYIEHDRAALVPASVTHGVIVEFRNSH